ncbi:MAG: hypothetical protein AB8G15_04515 [Saprospiraceae bacterium]
MEKNMWNDFMIVNLASLWGALNYKERRKFNPCVLVNSFRPEDYN